MSHDRSNTRTAIYIYTYKCNIQQLITKLDNYSTTTEFKKERKKSYLAGVRTRDTYKTIIYSAHITNYK
jgi:hypothetical protein